mmetsp:Transcript_7444/g.15931  ORF Transcript_7444/g.15931 Transcript_7444/m.15931 type:complete len:94 (+) Transcript_7444:302-583(+)
MLPSSITTWAVLRLLLENNYGMIQFLLCYRGNMFLLFYLKACIVAMERERFWPHSFSVVNFLGQFMSGNSIIFLVSDPNNITSFHAPKTRQKA